MNKEAKGRKEWIDVFRGAGCILVFFAHDLKTFHNIDTFFGKMGVSILFVLAGILTHRSLRFLFTNQGSIKAVIIFYLKRIIRIIPLYFISLMVYMVVLQKGWKDLLNHILMIKVTGHYWTIPVELLFYLIAPLLVLIERQIGAKKINTLSVINIAVIVFIWIISFITGEISRNSILFWLPLFLEGMYVDFLDYNNVRCNFSGGGTVLCMLTVGVFGFLYNQWHGHLNDQSFSLVMFTEIDELVYSYVIFGVFCSIIFSICLSNPDNMIKKCCEKLWLLKHVGIMSYPLYLFHYSIIVAIRKLDGCYEWTGVRIWETIFALTLSLAVSELMHTYIEKPIDEMCKRMLKR